MRNGSKTLCVMVGFGAALGLTMNGCAMESAEDGFREAQVAGANEHYGWWRTERASRQQALDAYLAKDLSANWKAYKNAPVSTSGIPMMMFRVMPSMFPEVWGDDTMSAIGFAKDDFEPGRTLPLGFGWTSVAYAGMPPGVTIGGATLTCGACHMGQVKLENGTTQHIVGAPSTTFSGYRGAVERSAVALAADGKARWTGAKFYMAVMQRAGFHPLTGLHPAYPLPALTPTQIMQRFSWVYGSETNPTRLITDYKVLIAGKAIVPLAEGIKSNVVKRKWLIDNTLGAFTYSLARVPNAPSLDAMTPGYLDAIGIGLTAIPPAELFANLNKLPPAPAMIDNMSTWRQNDRELAQWDGSITSRLHRNLAAELGVAASPYTVNFPNAIATTAFTADLPSAPYPFDVDGKAAMRGKRLYDEYCSSCHTVGDSKIYRDSGVDPNRANIWTDFTRTALIKLLGIACDPTQPDPALKNPVCAVDPENVIRADVTDPSKVGYTAPPLDGIWARAPYLHNGSVPTIAALLTGDRPAKFRRGITTYDQKNMGFVTTDETKGHEFDTTLSGQSNAGHDTAYYNGKIDWTTGHHLEDLIEYLKTL